MTELESAEVTLASLRDWAERTVAQVPPDLPRLSVARGYLNAAKDALIILDSRHLPPGAPIVFSSHAD
ncbi:MAG TPA: hypothetical protein VFW50_11970 [Streptosporangiaceae bacterium]|nr:hypothetical protein [Streptosporangiaceae bacterium]